MPITETKTSYKLDLKDKLKNVKESKRKSVIEDIANLLHDSILNDVSKSKSPVTGERFKPLSKDYKKFKKSKGKGSTPNLELTSKMLSALDVKTQKTGVKVQILGSKQQKAKSFNHNTGDTLPKRQFIPNDERSKKGGKFRKSILDAIDTLIEGAE